MVDNFVEYRELLKLFTAFSKVQNSSLRSMEGVFAALDPARKPKPKRRRRIERRKKQRRARK